jgi:hypothetical protein
MNTSAFEVTQLVLRERQSRDRGWYEDTAACYGNDCRIRMSWFTGTGRECVRRTRAMAGQGDLAVHRLGPPAIRTPGTARWQSYRWSSSGVLTWTVSRPAWPPHAAHSTGPAGIRTG